MLWLIGLVVGLMALASVLAMAEASISRMTVVRAKTLRQAERRNAAVLEAIANDPPRYLNSIYLAVMCAQNGSATLVALIAATLYEDLGITLVSIAFTLTYFVVVEAMSKTFGILHSDRVALLLSPMVWILGRALSIPTRALIGLANVLLPGKGLEQGPFVSAQEIRSMADVGHQEGAIDREEKDLIHSVFRFGDALIRQVMIPRPDIVSIGIDAPLREAIGMAVANGVSRLPACSGDLDHVEGVLHMRDALRAVHEKRDLPLREMLHPVHFVAETQRAVWVLREMQQKKFHMAIVVDEYGSAAGLVTLEDLLEELVGAITDEDEADETEVEHLDGGAVRVDAALGTRELSELLKTDFEDERWNTVGGLLFGVLGRIPTQGQTVSYEGHRFTAERILGRRVTRVLVEPLPPE